MPIALMKGFSDQSLAKDGIKLIGTGDFVTEDALNAEGDAGLGVVTSFHYSQAHRPSSTRSSCATTPRPTAPSRAPT
jgi:branched-chain amino acid transport system substrate-binding protein